VDRQRWEIVDRIFEAAVERAPADRRAFLEVACAGDSELRADVESLIAAHDRDDGFLEPPRTAASTADRDGRASPGESLGSYRIIRRLGHGGAGEVYLAEDQRLGRPVAIKLLVPHRLGDRDSIRRLRREALAASTLNHPNIVTIHEIGECQGREFIAAEFVEGLTLRERMRREDPPLAASIDIVLQAANALSAAHQAGIVHRDIKPENIMVRPDGLVKVLDFGIAKCSAPSGEVVSQTEAETAAGVVLGTVAYMSPEQARGESVDARTDIWSLGVVFYEMIARRPPFPGATAGDCFAAITGREPEPLRSLRRGIPSALEKVVNRALAKDRDSRYPSAAEMAEDLRRLSAKPAGRRAAWKLAFLSGTVAAVLLGFWFWRPVVQGSSRTVGSLAVLPFANASGSDDTDYLSDGITDSLINDLSDIGQLKVMSRNAVFSYKGRNVDSREVGRALGVAAVLTGRVTQRRDELSVSVELVDARDGSHIWGEHYTRDVAKLTNVQEEIARDVTERLRLRLSKDESDRLARRYTSNAEAYRLYLKGRFFWFKSAMPSWQSGSAPDFGKSREYFQQAIEVDPRYAPAYAFLGHYYAMAAGNGKLPPADNWPKAEAAFQKARELDPSLPEALTGAAVTAWMRHRDWAGAERMLWQAVRLNPAIRPESLLGRLLAAEGRFDEAVLQARRAVELDPLSLRFSAGLARVYYYARRYDEAISQYRQALELDPNDVFLHEALGDSYQRRGLERDAIAEWRAALTLEGDPSAAAVVDRAFRHGGFAAGVRAQAGANLRHIEQAARAGHYVPDIEFARARLRLNQKDQALQWLAKACDEHSVPVLFLNVDPLYDELRTDPRFQELAKCIQAPR
jgi:serine/threonine protein kinase/Flp pilus assembly protein TadD